MNAAPVDCCSEVTVILRRQPDPDMMSAEQAAAADAARELGLQDLAIVWMAGETMLTFQSAGPRWFAVLAGEVLGHVVSHAGRLRYPQRQNPRTFRGYAVDSHR